MSSKEKINLFLIFFYSAVLALLIFSLLNDRKENIADELNKKKPKPILNQFGFSDDSLVTERAKVLTNETLLGILSKSKISANKISHLLLKSKDYFNYHKIITGNNYHNFYSNDSLNRLCYFVYEQDPINYVVFDLNDSLRIYTGKKEVKTEHKTLAAVIKQSLYTTMLNSEANPELVIKLSEVFAWQIDFYRVQPGDYFKVIYDEEFVEGKSIGIHKITGAYFNYSSEEFFAIEFDQDSISQFFDENGKSLRKAFLKAPIEYSRISSKYSLKRLHPVQKIYKAHLGTDYAAAKGTPIRSIGDGVVLEASYTHGNGRYVKVKHNSVYTTQYLHMSKFAKGIKLGTHVKQAQVIGYVGSTGLATGPHLCYRFWKNGIQVDPSKEKIPPSHPVKAEYMEAYNKRKSEIVFELKKIELPFEDKSQLSSVLD